MPQFTQISTALRVASKNSSALIAGISIVAISRTFMREGQQFALVESEFVSDSQDCSLEYWASCDSVQAISGNYDSKYLSQLTHLSNDSVQKLLEEKANFLVFLRVYRIPVKTQQSLQFNRQFAALTSPIAVVDEFPIVSTIAFEQKKLRTQNRTCSKHPELEELQSAIASYAKDHPEAQIFSNELQEFLGWAEPRSTIDNIPDWVPQITTSGNSSDGYLFEKLVRKAFIQLGFTNTLNNALDPEAMGGAGGIDIYCEKPFAIVGECKASGLGNVGNGVCAQLINLGHTHLGKSQFESAVKIIFAAGKLNAQHAEPAAKENKMNVMRPDTLERLVKLKIAYPGSIDLLELKPCLEAAPFGTDADMKVNNFIDEIQQKLKVRSHVIQSVKSLKEDGDSLVSASTVRTHFNTAFAPMLKERLDTPEQSYSILIELSSPLTGYLGRIKCDTWRGDRFYFLRDLTV